MRKTVLVSLVTFFVASALLAQPSISSVLPGIGPAAGGTTVTIRGTGFSNCILCSPPGPPEVFFGNTPAASVQLVNETTIEAVSPPHPAGAVGVTVAQFNGATTLAGAFTYTGELGDAFERVLVPIFSPPVRGPFGSEFHTLVYASNTSKRLDQRALVYGLDTSCFLFFPILGPVDARVLEPGGTIELQPDCSTWPAIFFMVPKTMADRVTFNARVFDTSRGNLSHGTEIPIVRSNEFKNGRIVLVAVPLDERFRNTLRIYSDRATTVTVTYQSEIRTVQLQPGPTPFEPAYAALGNFPRQTPSIKPLANVAIDAPDGVPIWAFVSVTNNTT
ncbi:MAG TPA: IPT/TIG domain-containing protein, partial [Thermoanaerobaculia bacterium]|nr:IPT/TIG domain-containing protein [Thermoanaerobaculia bacterium]